MTTSRLYMNRPTPPPPYPNRIAYLTAKKPDDPKLCHVAVQDAGRKPWITVVLGSGCTTSAEQVHILFATAARLAEAVSRDFPQGQIDNEKYARIVRTFTDDLLRDRLRLKSSEEADAPSRSSVDIPEWMTQLFVAAALVTKLYHRAKFLNHAAPRRVDHEDEALLSQSSNSWTDLLRDYATPTHRILVRLEKSAAMISERLNQGLGLEDRGVDNDADGLTGTISALMRRVAHRVAVNDDTLTVGLLDIQSLAEFAWFCLTTISSDPKTGNVYPGWTDLLLDLSNYDPPEGRVGMPLFETMAAAQNIIQARYHRITTQSWVKRHGNHAFYEAVAELLIAEQQLYEKKKLKHGEPPLPTAFVTSFDVELELALLRAGRPFTVALPVHVVDVIEQVAHGCWVALKITPDASANKDAQLASLMTPDEGQLSILEDAPHEGGPFVVRLSGCPLIRLPALAATPKLREAAITRFDNSLHEEATWSVVGDASEERDLAIENQRTRIEQTLAWQHAVLINEHDAMLQNESDLIPSITSGLPKNMASDNRACSRFWMLLGVQIRDSAVRQRIATLVSSIPRIASGSGTKVQSAGVAVNAYIAELEQDLLFWNGFDVVCEPDLAQFGKDLEHVAGHLRSDADFAAGGRCDV